MDGAGQREILHRNLSDLTEQPNMKGLMSYLFLTIYGNANCTQKEK
jgi:hypothetical protein